MRGQRRETGPNGGRGSHKGARGWLGRKARKRGTGGWGPGIEEAWAWQPAGWELPPLGLRPLSWAFPRVRETLVSVMTRGAMTMASTSSMQT